MIVSYTAKSDARVYEVLAAVRQSVHHEIDDLIKSCNEELPDVELIFCPVVFPEAELNNWPEKVRRSRVEKWISFEKWLPFEKFLPPGRWARTAYVHWIKTTMIEAEQKYPDLSAARRLFDRLTE